MIYQFFMRNDQSTLPKLLLEVKCSHKTASIIWQALVVAYFGDHWTFRRDESLMGGYYADRHTGNCIEMR
jgi:hypothetical protein